MAFIITTAKGQFGVQTVVNTGVGSGSIFDNLSQNQFGHGSQPAVLCDP